MNQIDYNRLIALALENFALTMLIAAIIIGILEWLVQKMVKKASGADIFYRWIALIALGVTLIYAFVMHAFFPDLAAKTIGWPGNSPFQYEVAVADLSFGLIAIFSFAASYGFRLATVIGSTIWLWGDAAVHINDMMMKNNFAIGNAGSWLWMDILIPLLLIICIIKLRKSNN